MAQLGRLLPWRVVVAHAWSVARRSQPMTVEREVGVLAVRGNVLVVFGEARRIKPRRQQSFFPAFVRILKDRSRWRRPLSGLGVFVL